MRCVASIAHGEPLDPSIADTVASALKDWAVEHGATHYTHWFQPMTGITAEKHDSFLNPDPGRARRRGVQRQGAGQRRAGRLELPVGRHALARSKPGIHGLGPTSPPVAPGHAGRARRSSSRPRS